MAISIEAGKGRGEHQRSKVTIDGAMTIYDAAAGKTVLLDALDAADELVIDVSGVTEMDSAGLQLLLMIKREAAMRGKGMQLVAHSPAVLEVFDCYRLAAYFGDAIVIPSRANARCA